MRKSFAEADFEVLAEFWNEFYPAAYRVTPELLLLNTVQSPVFDWGASSIWIEAGEVCGFVSVKKSAAALYRGPDQDTANISAICFKDPHFGVDMMSDVKRTLRNRGCARVIFGQDSRHFFPGVPTEARSLADFLTIEGFIEGGAQFDLERDLSLFVNPYPKLSVNGLFRPVEIEDMGTLEQFLEREFPGRWTYDVMHKVRMEQSPNCVFGLFVEGKAEGFAMIQSEPSKVPIGGAVWQVALGSHWGALGPIGVSKALRGNGIGGALLGAALEHLRNKGVRRCIIDWTGLVEFYNKFGFEVSRTYRTYSMTFEN